MPVRKLVKAASHPDATLLVQRLIAEWQNPASGNPQPVILEQGGSGAQPLRVYVIWDDWEHLRQVERSQIIMDALEAVHGPAKTQDVSVALGLTSVEADRMGIRYQ